MPRRLPHINFFQQRVPPKKRTGLALLKTPLAVPVPVSNGEFHPIESHSTVSRNQPSSSTNGINNCPTSCLCSNNITFDYKNVRLLSQFTSTQTGMILPSTVTKICRKKQREIAKAVKRARIMGFMPFTSKITEYLNDPRLF